jgi:NTP pyrophosphatase (non-canonical NTP hydrolase)
MTPTQPNDDDLKADAAVLEKMTPGEWTSSREDMDSYSQNDDYPELGVQPVAYVYRKPEQRIGVWGDNFRGDSIGIAHLKRRAPAWLEELERLRAVVASTLQSRVQPWMMACFGAEISGNRVERGHRFLEEALELVQAGGVSRAEVLQLVDYVYGRPVGELKQEVGGVMVTLAALCLAHEIDMHECGETELARIWTKVEKIRAKRATKLAYSPLPTEAAALAASTAPTTPPAIKKEKSC